MSPILTTKEACAYMKCGRKFLYDEVKAGRIRARICGHGYRFHKADLERYVISGELGEPQQKGEGEMSIWEDQFEEIMDMDVPARVRNGELIELMNRLEKTHNIPGMRDPEFDQRNPELMELYRRISAARVF